MLDARSYTLVAWTPGGCWTCFPQVPFWKKCYVSDQNWGLNLRRIILEWTNKKRLRTKRFKEDQWSWSIHRHLTYSIFLRFLFQLAKDTVLIAKIMKFYKMAPILWAWSYQSILFIIWNGEMLITLVSRLRSRGRVHHSWDTAGGL